MPEHHRFYLLRKLANSTIDNRSLDDYNYGHHDEAA